MKISVITPIYKGEKYIEKLCDMVDKNAKAAQKKLTDIEVEYILINDYPIQPIPNEVIEKVKSSSEYISIIKFENSSNFGIHQSRVNGLRIATGEYVLFLDQDDEIEENTILSQIECLKKNINSDVVVANGYRKFIDGNDTKEIRLKELYARKSALKLVRNQRIYIYGTDMILSPGQCIIRKNAIPIEWHENILNTNGCDDFYLWLLMFENNCKFTINTDKLYYHTETKSNYSASADNMTKSYMAMCDILQKNHLISSKKIEILKRRYQLKVYLKGEKNYINKILVMAKNIDIIICTAFYKICGWH